MRSISAKLLGLSVLLLLILNGIFDSANAVALYDPRDEDILQLTQPESSLDLNRRTARSPGRCIDECSYDADCDSDMRCEYSGCGRLCL